MRFLIAAGIIAGAVVLVIIALWIYVTVKATSRDT